MKSQIIGIVEDYWRGRVPELQRAISEAARQIDNILTLENYYRSARTGEERLSQSFGTFGAGTLDLKSLSSVLQQGYGERGLQKARYQRIQHIAKELAATRAAYEKKSPPCGFIPFSAGAPAILDAFENHVANVAKTLGLIRMARLEAGGKYDPEAHGALFENFNWRQLDGEEMRLCPPFVVTAEGMRDPGAFLGELVHLVAAGKPFKLVVLRDSLAGGHTETGRAAALQGATDLELLFLSLRNVYFLQSSVASPLPLAEQLMAGLGSPRPAVFSILAPGADEEGFAERAARARRSRAFPHFVYDPDRANDFVSCLDLSPNEALEAVWPSAEREVPQDDGESRHVEYPYTFADFAAGEAEFQEQFHPLAAADQNHAMPLAEFLAKSPAERYGHHPFIERPGENGTLVRLAPSQAMLAHTGDRMHLWHTLQELAGIKNPYVSAAAQAMRQELTAEYEQKLQGQQADSAARIQAGQQEAVAAAMKNLAQRLTGGVLSAADLMAAAVPALQASEALPAESVGAPVAAPAAPAPAEAPPAAVSETPWVEEPLCTSCDECTDINKKIFAYNKEKKAYILDPRGGPYKDIVRAAEKCASGAIHPGLPLDPTEKDLDKLIQRAERFQ